MPPSEPVSTARIIVPGNLTVRAEAIFVGDSTSNIPPVVTTALYLLLVEGRNIKEIASTLFQSGDSARVITWLTQTMRKCQHQIQAMQASDLTGCSKGFTTLWTVIHRVTPQQTRSCPRCKGSMIVERDWRGVYSTCLSCGYVREDTPPPAIELLDQPNGSRRKRNRRPSNMRMNL